MTRQLKTYIASLGASPEDEYPIHDVDQVKNENDAYQYIKCKCAEIYVAFSYVTPTEMVKHLTECQYITAERIAKLRDNKNLSNNDSNVIIGCYLVLKCFPSWIDTIDSLSNENADDIQVAHNLAKYLSMFMPDMSKATSSPAYNWPNFGYRMNPNQFDNEPE